MDGHRVVIDNNAWSSIFSVSTFLDISYEFVHLAATTYNTRRYIDQLLHVSQGKQDMRIFIAIFNSLKAKVPTAFPEETLSYLFLQGCRPDLQRNITLQYPKTLAEYFQHAITLSDLPISHRPQPNVNKPPADSKPKTTSPMVCTHCGKPGHTEDRCFQLHPELRRRRLKASKP
jgi:hypothetical protein